MISFNEALGLAKKLRSDIDYCIEYEDAFIFSLEDDCSIGGNGPVVVLKADGECINMTAYIDETDCTGVIREGRITDLIAQLG